MKNIPYELQLLNEWTERLALKDWKIVLCTNVEPEDMEIENSDGCAAYEESIKAATIQIVRPDAYKNRLREFDIEETLVHELLHLKMSLLSTDNEKSIQDRVLHQIIDDTIRALVNAKRANRSQT